MQLNDTEKMAMEVGKVIKKVFGDKELTINIFDIVDDARHRQFAISFLAYNYFVVVFSYERDLIGCCIAQADSYIPLIPGNHWYSSESMEEYFNAVSEELKLRIPDKYLKAKGWL